MVFNFVDKPVLMDYLQRNFEQINARMSPYDAWMNYLQGMTGLTSDSMHDLESAMLTSLGFQSDMLFDQWQMFMNEEGFGGQTLRDAMMAYFSSTDTTFETGGGTGMGLLLALTYS